MDSLTPFVRHVLEEPPGSAGAPGAASSRRSPPLGTLPPSDPTAPGIQLPPPALPQQPPPVSSPRHGVPMTDGTPVACRQKNAQAFLAGERDLGVMAHYAPGLFSTRQQLRAAQPAPDEDEAAVRELVDWREEFPYG